MKTERDLLIYIAWKSGLATNRKIATKFELAYSAVNHRVTVIKKMLNNDTRQTALIARFGGLR
jgi:hypothetical protein